MADRTFKIDVLIKAHNDASNAINKFAEDVKKAEDGLEGFNKTLKSLKREADKTEGLFQGLNDKSKDLNRSLQTTVGRQEKFSDGLKEMNKNISTINRNLEKMGEGFKGVGTAASGTQKQIDDTTKSTDDLSKVTKHLGDAQKLARSELEKSGKTQNLKNDIDLLTKSITALNKEKKELLRSAKEDDFKRLSPGKYAAEAGGEIVRTKAGRKPEYEARLEDRILGAAPTIKEAKQLVFEARTESAQAEVEALQKKIDFLTRTKESLIKVDVENFSEAEGKLEALKSLADSLDDKKVTISVGVDKDRTAQELGDIQDKIDEIAHTRGRSLEQDISNLKLAVTRAENEYKIAQANKAQVQKLALDDSESLKTANEELRDARRELAIARGNLSRGQEARTQGIQRLEPERILTLFSQLERDIQKEIGLTRRQVPAPKQLEEQQAKIDIKREELAAYGVSAERIKEFEEETRKSVEAANKAAKERVAIGEDRLEQQNDELALAKLLAKVEKTAEEEAKARQTSKTRPSLFRAKSIAASDAEERAIAAGIEEKEVAKARKAGVDAFLEEKRRNNERIREEKNIRKEKELTIKKEKEARREEWTAANLSRGTSRDSLRGLALSFQGYQIAFAIKYAQALLTSVTALVTELIAVGSAAISAGAALGGALAAGAAQAIGPIALLGATVSRFTAIGKVLNLRQQLQQGAPHRAAQAARKEASGGPDAGAQADAADRLAAAQEGLRTAQERLTKARQDALKNLQDLIDKEAEAAIAAQRSTLSVEQSQLALQNALDTGGADKVASAQLDLQSSRLDRSQAFRDARQSARDASTARRQGVEGNPDVVAAKRDVEKANRALANSERDLAQAQKKSGDAAAGATAQQDRYGYLLSQLTGAERGLLNQLVRLQDAYRKAFRPITDIVIGAFSSAVGKIIPLLSNSKILGAFTNIANAIARSISRISSVLSVDSPFLAVFFGNQSVRTIDKLTAAFLNVFKAFTNIAIAANPVFNFIIDTVVRLSKLFLNTTSDASKLGKFFRDSQSDLQAVFRLIRSVWEVFKALFTPGRRVGNTAINEFATRLSQLAKFLRENEKEVQRFFERGHYVFNQLIRVVIALAKAIVTTFDEQTVKAFVDMIVQILVPALTSAVKIMGSLTQVFHELATLPGISQLIQFAATLFLVARGYEIIRKTIFSLASTIAAVMSGMNPLMRIIVMVGAAFAVLGGDLEDIKKLLKALEPAIIGVVLALGLLKTASAVSMGVAAARASGAFMLLKNVLFAVRTGVLSLRGAFVLLARYFVTNPYGALLLALGAIGGIIASIIIKQGREKTAAQLLEEQVNKTAAAYRNLRDAQLALKDSQFALERSKIAKEQARADLQTLETRLAAKVGSKDDKISRAEERKLSPQDRRDLRSARLTVRESDVRVEEDARRVEADRQKARGAARKAQKEREEQGELAAKAHEKDIKLIKRRKELEDQIANAPPARSYRASAEQDRRRRELISVNRQLAKNYDNLADATDRARRAGEREARARGGGVASRHAQAQSIREEISALGIRRKQIIAESRANVAAADTDEEKNRARRIGQDRLRKNTEALRDKYEELRKKFGDTRGSAREFARQIDSSTRQVRDVAPRVGGKKGLAGSFSALGSVVGAVIAGVKEDVNNGLLALGANKIDIKVAKKVLMPFFAQGGLVGNKGERGRDKIPILVGRGEAVLNHAQQSLVEPALHAFYGHGLEKMFNRTDSTHAGDKARGFAGGGFTGPFGSLSAMNVIANLASRFGLSVSAGRIGHTYMTASGNVSDHSWGGALDVSNGVMTKQEWAFANFLKNRVRGIIKQLIFNNTILAGSGLGGFVADHKDHVHIAILSQFAHNQKVLARIISKALGGANVDDLIKQYGGGGSGRIATPKVKKREITGKPEAVVKLGRAAEKKLRTAGQRKLDREAAKVNVDRGGPGAPDAPVNLKVYPPGQGRRVGATTFGGPGDPATGSQGYKGDNLYAHPDSYAELNMGSAMGGLPYLHPLRVTANGRSAILRKRDIGAGGGPVGGLARVIDLWYQAAQRLGLPGVWSGIVKIANVGGGRAKGGFTGGDYKMSNGKLLPFLGSFQGGSDKILRDGLALLHKDEMVLPATIARLVRRDSAPRQIGRPEEQPTTDSRGRLTLKSLYAIVDKWFPKGNIFGDIVKRTYKRLESNLHGIYDGIANKKWDDVSSKLRMLTSDDGPLAKIPEFIDEFSARLEARRVTARYGFSTKVNTRGQRVLSRTFEKTDDVGSARLEASDSTREINAVLSNRSYLQRSSSAVNKIISRLKKSDSKLHNELDKIREGGVTKSEEKRAKQIKKEIEDLQSKGQQARGAQTKIKSLFEDLNKTLAQKIQDAIEKQKAYIQAIIDRNSDKYDARRSLAEANKKIGQLTNNFNRVAGSNDIIIQSYVDQAEDLRKLFHSGKVKDPKQKRDLEIKIKELDVAILEAIETKIQDAIDLISKVGDRQRGAAERTSKIADIFTGRAVKAREFGYALKGQGIQQQIGAAEQEKQALKNLFWFTPAGDARDKLTDRLADLDVSLGELANQLKDNTTALIDSNVSALQETGGFQTGISTSVIGFLNTLAENTGVPQTQAILDFLRRNTATLTGQRSGLIDQLGALIGPDAINAIRGQSGQSLVTAVANLGLNLDTSNMTPAEQILFRKLIAAILDNESAVEGNTKEIRELTGTVTQSFSTTAWSRFRQAIFDGMGGLLPQYAQTVPHLASGGYIKQSGMAFVHQGELVMPASKVNRMKEGSNNEINVNLTSPTEVADPMLIGKRIAYELKGVR